MPVFCHWCSSPSIGYWFIYKLLLTTVSIFNPEMVSMLLAMQILQSTLINKGGVFVVIFRSEVIFVIVFVFVFVFFCKRWFSNLILYSLQHRCDHARSSPFRECFWGLNRSSCFRSENPDSPCCAKTTVKFSCPFVNTLYTGLLLITRKMGNLWVPT